MFKKLIVTVGLVLGITSIIFARVDPEPKTVVKAKWSKEMYYEKTTPPKDGEFGWSYDGEWWKIPENFTVDKEGNIYISDEFHNRIQVFNKNGKFIRAIPNNVKDFFKYSLKHMVADDYGNVIVSTRGKLIKFNPEGEVLFEEDLKGYWGKMFLNPQGNVVIDRVTEERVYSSETGKLIKRQIRYDPNSDVATGEALHTIKGHKGKEIPLEFEDHRKLAKKREITIPEEEYGRLIGFDKDNNTYWEYGPKAGKYVIYIYDDNGNLTQKLEPQPSITKAPGIGFGPGRRFVVDYWGNIYQFIMYPEKGIEILKYERID